MPARREPRVEAEPHGGPPAVTGPHRFRPNPAELCEALEGALDDPGFRQARPFVPVHVPVRKEDRVVLLGAQRLSCVGDRTTRPLNRSRTSPMSRPLK